MLGALSFKGVLSNERGTWVNIREINYLIQKGIITVDTQALKNFVDNEDEEFNEYMSEGNGIDEWAKDMFGRVLDEKERRLYEAALRESRGIRSDRNNNTDKNRHRF